MSRLLTVSIAANNFIEYIHFHSEKEHNMACATTITTRPTANLTSKDAAVLQALFDAESSPSSSSNVVIDASLPSFPGIPDADLARLKERELHAIRQIQQSGSNNTTPSPETVEAAIAELDAVIAEYPSYPSAYVNRAQALRVLIECRGSSANDSNNSESENNALFSPENTSLATRLFSDLSQAITLVSPSSSPSSNSTTVSPAQARILADAHTHRGYLLLKAAKQKSSPTDPKNGAGAGAGAAGPAQLAHITGKDQLEELASRDFALGGRYGNKIAAQLAVQTNPYAKMCGAIVKEAMRKEVVG